MQEPADRNPPAARRTLWNAIRPKTRTPVQWFLPTTVTTPSQAADIGGYYCCQAWKTAPQLATGTTSAVPLWRVNLHADRGAGLNAD